LPSLENQPTNNSVCLACDLFRDLKPSNLGFGTGDVIQLFDFGLCRELPKPKGQAVHDEDMQDDETFHMSGVGTQRYMSPETLNSTRRYNAKSDCFSLSVVCLEMMTWRKPFQEYSAEEHIKFVAGLGERPKLVKDRDEMEISEGETDDEFSDVSDKSLVRLPSRRLRPVLVSDWPEGMADLLEQAWAHDVAERLTMQSIFERLGSILERFDSAPTPDRSQDPAPRQLQQTEDCQNNNYYGLRKWEETEVVLEFPSHFTPRHQMSARSRHRQYQEQQLVQFPLKATRNSELPLSLSGPSLDDSEDRWFCGGDRQSDASSSMQELTMTSASTTLHDSTSTP
jgi:serine/threonine protein kinase